MLTFLLVVQALIAAALVAVILMQRSEGGGLGMGGSPSGLMSARGAADFLTRTTTILATAFVVLCIILSVVAAQRAAPGTIDTSLRRTTPAPAAPAPAVPLGGDPLAAAAQSGVPSNASAPAALPTVTPTVTRHPDTAAATGAVRVERKPAAPVPAVNLPITRPAPAPAANATAPAAQAPAPAATPPAASNGN